MTFRTIKDNQLVYLADLLGRPECSKYLHSTNSNRFVNHRLKTKTGSRDFCISGPALRNALSGPIRIAGKMLTFRKLLKSHLFDINPPADGLDLTMRGTLNIMFDYCSIPLSTYFKLGAQAGFLSNFEKSPYLCFWRSRLG